jgi:hypothetical protein
MSLPIPNLDDRNFEDLMKEALSLIPVYDRSWTNYNPSDPGITLLELFSWLSEMTIYRLNRIPEENYRRFLELLGVKYLFKWNEIPGNVTGLLEYLVETFKADWVRIALTEKNDVDRLIRIYLKNDFEDHSIMLKLNDEEDKVTITLENGATHDLNVKKELKIYEKSVSGTAEGWLFRWNRIPGTDKDRLISSLIQKDSKYTWLRDASLEKIDKEKTLHFFKEGSYLYVRLDEDENEVTLSEDVTSETIVEKYKFDVVKDLKIYESIEYDIRKGLQSISKRYRAITSGDFEFLTNECIEALQEGLSGRAICVNNRDLEYAEDSNDNSFSGHVSVIIVPGVERPEFAWHDITGKDSLRLLKFLIKIYDANWLKSAKIESSQDGNTVTVSEVQDKGNISDITRSISLKLNQEKVTLESQFYASYELVSKMEAKKLNVYCFTVDGKPSDLLKDQVRKYLEKRKLVTTRLHVVEPDYRKVTLSASISLKENTLKAIVIENVKNLIIKYFSSLEGGKDNKGWPAGRNLYKSEIYQLLERIPGVDHVVEIKIDGSDFESIELKEHQLIELTVDKIEVCDE